MGGGRERKGENFVRKIGVDLEDLYKVEASTFAANGSQHLTAKIFSSSGTLQEAESHQEDDLSELQGCRSD